MPPNLNNEATTDAYTSALTVKFPTPRRSFTLHVFNAAVMYQVAAVDSAGLTRDIDFEVPEHFLAPSLSNFNDPAREGFPQGWLFAGVRMRSAAAGVPARVTVI